MGQLLSSWYIFLAHSLHNIISIKSFDAVEAVDDCPRIRPVGMGVVGTRELVPRQHVVEPPCAAAVAVLQKPQVSFGREVHGHREVLDNQDIVQALNHVRVLQCNVHRGIQHS